MRVERINYEQLVELSDRTKLLAAVSVDRARIEIRADGEERFVWWAEHDERYNAAYIVCWMGKAR